MRYKKSSKVLSSMQCLNMLRCLKQLQVGMQNVFQTDLLKNTITCSNQSTNNKMKYEKCGSLINIVPIDLRFVLKLLNYMYVHIPFIVCK